MRQIHVRLSDNEEIIRLWATGGRKYWYAVCESEDESGLRYTLRFENGARILARGVSRTQALADAQTSVKLARQLDRRFYKPIETSSAIVL